MSRFSQFLVKYELNDSDKEDFRIFVLRYNVNHLRALSIFGMIVEAILIVLYFSKILDQSWTTAIVIFPIFLISAIGFILIKTLAYSNNIRRKEITIVGMMASLVAISIFIVCAEFGENSVIFHVAIFGFNIMMLNKPIKSLMVSVLSYITLIVGLLIYDSASLTTAIIANTFVAVGIAVMASVVTYNNQLRLFIEKKERKLANDKLTTMANTDQLTGLNNRRRIGEVITTQIGMVEKDNKPLSVILMDIDHFKKINDVYGHPLGDEVLVEFSDIIKKSLRYEDTAGRWGGEEFIIICSNTTSDEAKAIAERLREKINNQSFAQDISVNASFGISQIKDNMTIRELIASADRALYRAKQNGRNRVEVLDIA